MVLFFVMYATAALAYRVAAKDRQPGLRGLDWFVASNLLFAGAVALALPSGQVWGQFLSSTSILMILIGHTVLHWSFAEIVAAPERFSILQLGLLMLGILVWADLSFFPHSPLTFHALSVIWGAQYFVTGLMLFRTRSRMEWLAGGVFLAYSICHVAFLLRAGIGQVAQNGSISGAPPSFRLFAHGAIAFTFFFIAASRLKERLERDADIDELTGLMNLRAIRRAGLKALERCRVEDESLSVLMIDVDGLKRANDWLGHGAGDLLLQTVAASLLQSLREKDSLARVGGDEFCLLLPDADEKEAVRVAERCRAALLRIVIPYGEHVLEASASFGVANSMQCGLDWEALLRHSDSAMYRAKRNGRNRVSAGDRSRFTFPRREINDDLQQVC